MPENTTPARGALFAALGFACPNCQAKAGERCTVPTSTARRGVDWIHDARVNIAREAGAFPAEPTVEQYAQLGRFTAALLGSQLEWNGGDICEGIAEAAAEIAGFPAIGGQTPDQLKLWRGVADDLGIYYPDDEVAE